MTIPKYTFEQKLTESGYSNICGLDEAGRGAWAGPIVAGAVILPGRIYKVRDSKLLKASDRTTLARKIKRLAIDWSVGVIEVEEINQNGFTWACHEVFRRAINNLKIKPDHLLVDYVKIKAITIPQIAIIKGDQLITSVAAASIIAKTHRDALLRKLGRQKGLHSYNFTSNKGYGTKKHQAAIEKHGLTCHHRMIIKRFWKLEQIPFDLALFESGLRDR